MNEEIKKYLNDFKTLPKYQVERRLDIFLLPYLETVCSNVLNDDIKFLYPEFPLHKLNHSIKKFSGITMDSIKEIAPINEMYNSNVDYCLVSDDTVYLTELKTEKNSFKDINQLIYYAYYSGMSFQKMLEFFKILSEKQKGKWWNGYDYLQKTFQEKMKISIERNKIVNNIILYIGPKSITDLEEYSTMVNLLGEKFKFISLSKFANYTEEPLKSLLYEFDPKP